MPIRPENKDRYPKNWKEIREHILERANNRCEFCGVENHTYRMNEKTGKMAFIVLTIAHMNEVVEDCSDENLKALCQRCHNRYDVEHRRKTRSHTRAMKLQVKYSIKKMILTNFGEGNAQDEEGKNNYLESKMNYETS